MCHFHSIIVSTDGRVYHLPENSHSGIAAHYGLVNGPEKREFYEVEWDGRGQMPADLVRDRPYGSNDFRDIPALVQRTAERHYEKLAAILRGELNWRDTAPFNEQEYADVVYQVDRERIEAERREAERVARAEAEARKAEAEELAAKLAEAHEAEFINLEADGREAFIRALLEAIGEEATEVFETEFEEAREEADESGYERGRDDGFEAAAEDMYTADYVYENFADFAGDDWIRVEDAAEHCEDEITQAREEGFKEGFAAARTGATPAPAFINGLPSFLFG